MNRSTLAGGALVAALILLVVFAIRDSATEPRVEEVAAPDGASPSTAAESTPPVDPAFLYGRVTVDDGTVYEGRLRWGTDQEAFWGDYFDGSKDENPWAAHAPGARRSGDGSPVEIFGLRIGGDDGSANLGRPFMARLGDIARIQADDDVQVRLKSGTMFLLDRSDAGDIDDGVRVWDRTRGIVDVDSGEIRTIEFLPAASAPAEAAGRLHGTVRTLQGDFTGHIQWHRADSLGADELTGRTADGEVSLRYDTMRSVARHSRDSARVTLQDGRELVLSGTAEAGQGHRGIYVDDARYGRVLVSWNAFDRVDFSPGGSGPSYGDFPAGRALTGTVTSRGGRRLAGRLVYDFDESETTETMDADLEGVSYNIPFGLIASIAPRGPQGDGAPRATVILHRGEELQLERKGDLAGGNAGVLIFVDGRDRPEHVVWADVERIDFDPVAAMYPPLARP